MRRCELAVARRDGLDLDAAATLTIEITRVVVDGQVIESDGKTVNGQRTLALDPLTLAALKLHVEMLDQERAALGPDYEDHGLLFCWETDWKALSTRICHADVAFTMRQYVQTDLAADRKVANTLAKLIIGGSLASVELDGEGGGQDGGRGGLTSIPSANPLASGMQKAPPVPGRGL